MRKVNLGDVATIAISNVDKKTVDGEIPVKLCNFVDVYHNWAVNNSLRDELMDATAKPNQVEKFALKKGQVAITKDSETRDDIGIATYIADTMDDVVLGYHTALITPDETEVNGKYLNAYLHSPIAGKYFEHHSSGSGQRYALTDDIIAELPLYLPDLATQEETGELFSSIDRAIKNKQVRIEKLEEIAHLIYDYWFTQFDFPDENGKPYRSSGGKMVWNEELKREIPEGWKVSRVKELAPVITGKEDANFSSIDGKYKFFTCAQEPLACDTPAFEGNAILIAGNGDFNVKHFSGKFNAYQRTYVIIPDKPAMYYPIYIAAKKQIEAFTKGSAGSIVKFITKGDVESIPVVVPNDLGLFSIFNNILNRVEGIDRENEELIKLRDWLLPMLMNGQAIVEKKSA